MDATDFDELAGRIEGLARAVLTLAWAVECETDMDGLTLTRRWRESVPPQADAGSLRTARNTLHELAQALDALRTSHQESVLRAKLGRIGPVE
ncbi:hypothetical protein HNQ51_001739 [Inhella inkyongensis]|uniref:Uncharacterized protein n=1 Tax=Inhella inkyongensis TaxID=392593 RepID=A0A840S293_9BURK|nr:hypothetical protein [Inhella inkyongensis]MBB5204425.1 hypothetical protein [Inhella inkyongensis]